MNPSLIQLQKGFPRGKAFPRSGMHSRLFNYLFKISKLECVNSLFLERNHYSGIIVQGKSPLSLIPG